jgi:hypothetical protein
MKLKNKFHITKMNNKTSHLLRPKPWARNQGIGLTRVWAKTKSMSRILMPRECKRV